MLRVNSKPHKLSAAPMLETYVLSQAIGTPKTSSMILGELRRKLNNTLAPALVDNELECLRYLDSSDPAREVVKSFCWRTAGSSPSSDHSDQGDDGDEMLRICFCDLSCAHYLSKLPLFRSFTHHISNNFRALTSM